MSIKILKSSGKVNSLEENLSIFSKENTLWFPRHPIPETVLEEWPGEERVEWFSRIIQKELHLTTPPEKGIVRAMVNQRRKALYKDWKLILA